MKKTNKAGPTCEKKNKKKPKGQKLSVPKCSSVFIQYFSPHDEGLSLSELPIDKLTCGQQTTVAALLYSVKLGSCSV